IAGTRLSFQLIRISRVTTSRCTIPTGARSRWNASATARYSNSSSNGSTGVRWQSMPCLMELREDFSFPRDVFGPVDLDALRRLASSFFCETFFCETMARLLSSGNGERWDRETHGPEARVTVETHSTFWWPRGG